MAPVRKRKRKGEIVARVCRATYAKLVPDDAKIITKRGRQFAQFKTVGRMVEAPLTKDHKKCWVETLRYSIRYNDAEGCWHQQIAYTSRAASEALAVKIRKREERRQIGLTAQFEGQYKEPLVELMALIQAKLQEMLQRQRFFTIAHAAIYSDLPDYSIRLLIERGELLALRPIGGRILVDREELDAVILGSRQAARKGTKIERRSLVKLERRKQFSELERFVSTKLEELNDERNVSSAD